MPALNFKKQFAPKVESGKKRQTIRRKRRDGKYPRPGQTLYLYTGMRTKSCRKLGEETCKSSLPILIDGRNVVVGGQLLSADEELKLAQADGFEGVEDFRNFFSNQDADAFDGVLICW